MIQTALITFLMTLVSGLAMLWSYHISIENTNHLQSEQDTVAELIREN